ncbi:MAG: hypothetical protein ACR2IH_07495 [Pyrinomonadaceae bacterium]
MYSSRTKADMMIEVWERLDCESVGSKEIVAIENAVRERYGTSAVESPMIVARLLADEGAELRHSEIMQLYVERASDRPYDAALRNIARLADLTSAEGSIRNMESLRKKLTADGDKPGLRLLRQDAIEGRDRSLETARSTKTSPVEKNVQAEIAEWITLWLNSPEMFAQWLALRKRSTDFRTRFAVDQAET